MVVVFDEPFFDSVIARMGGRRLQEVATPPPDSRHADYLLEGFVVELKILKLDPLASEQHQKSVAAHLEKAKIAGHIVTVRDGQEFNIVDQGSQKLWHILAKPVMRALRDAEEQVIASQKFLNGQWKGGVILVNAGAVSLSDPNSFFRLISDYHQRLSHVKVILAFNTIPTQDSEGRLATANATISYDETDELLGRRFEEAIQDEIFARTGFRGKASALDTKAQGGQVKFRNTTQGLRKI